MDDAAQAATVQPVAVRISMVAAEGKTIPRLLQVPLTLVTGEVAP